MEFTNEQLIERVNQLYRELEIYDLKRQGKPVTESSINWAKGKRTVSLTEPANLPKGRKIHIINVNTAKHYRILQENPKMLKPHEILGSRNTNVYGPLPSDSEKAAAKAAGKRPSIKNQRIHAEQLGANDGVRMGSRTGRIATSNNGCSELCLPLLTEEFPGYEHVNPAKKINTPQNGTASSRTGSKLPPPIPRTAGQPPFAPTNPKAITKYGVIETKAPNVPSDPEVGTRSTEGGARGLAPKTWSPEAQKKPIPAPQLHRPSAPNLRSVIKGNALNLKKIRESAIKALRPRIGVAKHLAKGIGKGLIIGIVVGLLESYLFDKLAGWLLKDEGIKRLNELEKRKGPEIERRTQKAVEDYVKNLARRSGTVYKIILEFRLVNYFAVGSIYLPHDLIVDEAYVTELFWTKKEECVEAEVTPDVTEVTLVGDGKLFRKGEKITLHQQQDLFQVLKCTRILDFDDPDVGDPPLEGTWRDLFIDKNAPDKKHLATTYTITFSGANPKVSGINAIDNKKLRIWAEEWTGHFLKFKVKRGKYIEHMSVSFDKWDVLTGWSDIYEGYSRVQPSSRIRWERIIP